MKIITYNIRAFGSGLDSKYGPTKRLILKEKPNFLALQETKLHPVNLSWIQTFWGSVDCEFIQQPMVGLSGGQLLIWDTTLFDAYDVIIFDRVIGVRGTWKSSSEKLNVVNVYGPHDDTKKQLLWNSLSALIENDPQEAWVLCGDFNEVRDETKRLNCVFNENRARRFNSFILNNNLVDIPMGGRKFTRVCDNGIKFSKIDRFLVS
ncbi:uncharacterized protein [Rutidosis leptorrhynchoides]|uniref:uncharacterized protein n=1 Tax=Rutidosis leptorrhynchoides TaxID=125765 RepID=UPI003A992991